MGYSCLGRAQFSPSILSRASHTSQSLTVQSSKELKRERDSVQMRTELTQSVWPFNVKSSFVYSSCQSTDPFRMYMRTVHASRRPSPYQKVENLDRLIDGSRGEKALVELHTENTNSKKNKKTTNQCVRAQSRDE